MNRDEFILRTTKEFFDLLKNVIVCGTLFALARKTDNDLVYVVVIAAVCLLTYSYVIQTLRVLNRIAGPKPQARWKAWILTGALAFAIAGTAYAIGTGIGQIVEKIAMSAVTAPELEK